MRSNCQNRSITGAPRQYHEPSGLRKIRISPHLAYGDKDWLAIPPNPVLKFEVELLALRKR